MFPTIKRTESEMAWSDSARGVSESLFDKARLIFQDASRIQKECEELRKSLQEHVDAVDAAKCHFVDKDEIIAINKNIARLLEGISVEIDEYAGQDEAQIAAAKELDKYIGQLESELDEHAKNQTRPDIPLLETIYNASLSDPQGPTNDRAQEKILSCAIPVQRATRKRLASLLNRAKEIAAKAADVKEPPASLETPPGKIDEPVENRPSQEDEVPSFGLQVEAPSAREASSTIATPSESKFTTVRKRGRRGGKRQRRRLEDTRDGDTPTHDAGKSRVAATTHQESEAVQGDLVQTKLPSPKESVRDAVGMATESDRSESVPTPMDLSPLHPNPAVVARTPKAATNEPAVEGEVTRPSQSYASYRPAPVMEHQPDEQGMPPRRDKGAAKMRSVAPESASLRDDQEEDERTYTYRLHNPFAGSRFYDEFADAFHPGMFRYGRPQTAPVHYRSDNHSRRARQTPRRVIEEEFGPLSPFEYFAADPITTVRFPHPMQYMMQPLFPYYR